jgi:hypothetical protein
MAKENKKIIGRPAGENASFILHVADTQIICEEGVLKPDKKNTKTIILGSASRLVEQPLSTKLDGVTIKAYDNDKDRNRDR